MSRYFAPWCGQGSLGTKPQRGGVPGEAAFPLNIFSPPHLLFSAKMVVAWSHPLLPSKMFVNKLLGQVHFRVAN